MAKKKQAEEVQQDEAIVEASTETVVEPVQEPSKEDKKKLTLEEKLTEALKPYVGQRVNSSNASTIKSIIYNLVGDGTQYSINKDGSIAVNIGESLVTIK